MSPALKDFWLSQSRFPAGCFSPKRYGTSGCIPELVKSVDESFSGKSEADGTIACPRFLKNSRYFFLTLAESIDS
jgi:hypothetical protein